MGVALYLTAWLPGCRVTLGYAGAAEKYRVPYCLSTMSTCSIEEITRETVPQKWFQLYVLRDRELTRDFIERARASSCTALVLTVDTKVQGPRERDMRIGRAWLYGLASGGQPGVERALEILRDEIDITLTLPGRPTLAEIDRQILQG